jgi:hypothetical protein
MGNSPERLRTTCDNVVLELARTERLAFARASVLHHHVSMETLVLTAAMTLSGLLAIGSTRALLGVVLLAITRNAN